MKMAKRNWRMVLLSACAVSAMVWGGACVSTPGAGSSGVKTATGPASTPPKPEAKPATAPAKTPAKPAPTTQKPAAKPTPAAQKPAPPAKAAAKPAPGKPAPKAEDTGMSFPASFPGPMLKKFQEGPLKDVEEVVFAVRVPGRDHWYVTFGNYSIDAGPGPDRGFRKEEGVWWGYGEGGRLCLLNLRTGKVKVILKDPKGGIRDPQVHYDGHKILFSYRKGDERAYHLYEIGVDGSGLRQLTDGPDDDIEPTYCPDGSIIFCSSRCRRFVNCWYTRVATLYRCDGDGKNVRMLSSNNDHDNTPWLLSDGRVLYMRWEYVDRSQVHFHHLWTMNPDGTEQTVFYGNMRGGTTMLDAKPIPGTTKVVASFSPGHGRPEHVGPVTIVDPGLGPDDPAAARKIGNVADWKDPYPIAENCFLVAHAKGLFVLGGDGKSELIYKLPDDEKQFQCSEPRPLLPHPREHVIPPRVKLAKDTGRLFLQDIYQGRNMVGVKRGAIKKLLVLQQLPKPINFSGGMQPLTIGGTFTLAEIVGEAPVEPDGSAFIEVPALRSLFLVALDEKDLSVKRMHSFVTLQPGETTGCVGCHEKRTQTPLPGSPLPMALKKPPAMVRPVADVPSVPDFPRDIQPILDKHCVSCHNPDKRDGKVDLCGDKTPGYTISYWTMNLRRLVADGRNQPFGNRPPYSDSSGNSPLMKLLDGGHYEAKLSDREIKTIRLWIEASATYPGTYAALGCGEYRPASPQQGAYRRCLECHTGTAKDRKTGKEYKTMTICGLQGQAIEIYQNISRPEKALMLTAPLAKEAGGLGLCKEAVFKDRNDPAYKSILAVLQDTHNRLMQFKRFDMAGFRPNRDYVREMQRFGFLPKDLGPDTPVDVYSAERAYWDSFYYKPPAESGAEAAGVGGQ